MKIINYMAFIFIFVLFGNLHAEQLDLSSHSSADYLTIDNTIKIKLDTLFKNFRNSLNKTLSDIKIPAAPKAVNQPKDDKADICSIATKATMEGGGMSYAFIPRFMFDDSKVDELCNMESRVGKGNKLVACRAFLKNFYEALLDCED